MCGFDLDLTQVTRKWRKDRHTSTCYQKARSGWVVLSLREQHHWVMTGGTLVLLFCAAQGEELGNLVVGDVHK